MGLDRHLESAWWALRIGLGVTAFLAGLDKFFNILTNWSAYVSPLAERVLPISVSAFLGIVGVVEMSVGIAVLTAWTRLGSYVAMAWLIGISLNLGSTGQYFDIAVRDVVLALAAYTLARLTEARQSADGFGNARSDALRTPWGKTAQC